MLMLYLVASAPCTVRSAFSKLKAIYLLMALCYIMFAINAFNFISLNKKQELFYILEIKPVGFPV